MDELTNFNEIDLEIKLFWTIFTQFFWKNIHNFFDKWFSVLDGSANFLFIKNKMDIIQQRLSFRTDFFLNDAFNSEHAIKYFDISPINWNWSFTILICFLNQLPNFQKNFSLPFKKLTNNDYCARFSLIYNNNPQTEIIIFVGENIKVKATRTLITTLFKPARFWFFSQLRSWNKTRCHQKYQQHISYILFFNKYNDGTKAFFITGLLFFALHMIFHHLHTFL